MEQRHGSKNGVFGAIAAIASAVSIAAIADPASALPPPEDLPEEILRTEIITEARSPVDGRPLTPSEYATVENPVQTARFGRSRPRTTIAEPPDAIAPEPIVEQLPVREILRSIFPF
jgi:hypothetical protein